MRRGNGRHVKTLLVMRHAKSSWAVAEDTADLDRPLTGRGKRDAEAMAAQLCFPVSVWINLCDREPEREAEAMALIERHIRQYFALYGARGQNEDGGGHADE